MTYKPSTGIAQHVSPLAKKTRQGMRPWGREASPHHLTHPPSRRKFNPSEFLGYCVKKISVNERGLSMMNDISFSLGQGSNRGSDYVVWFQVGIRNYISQYPGGERWEGGFSYLLILVDGQSKTRQTGTAIEGSLSPLGKKEVIIIIWRQRLVPIKCI